MPLRTKVTLIFGLIALIASVSLTVVTYTFARSSLLDQRATVAERQAIFNAREVQQQLETLDRREFGEEYFPTVQIENDGVAFLRLDDGSSYGTNLRFTDEQFPNDLRQAVARGSAGVQQFEVSGDPYMGVGIPLGASSANYYEAFQLSSTEDSLQSILLALVIGSAITVLLATAAGWWTRPTSPPALFSPPTIAASGWRTTRWRCR